MKYVEQYELSEEVKNKLIVAEDYFDAHYGMGYGTPVEKQVNIAHTTLVQRLFKQSKSGDKQEMLIHAAMGISGEAGELLDAVKKHVFYDRELDMGNIVEELGDLLFYIQALMQVINVRDPIVKAANIYKLDKRYPSGEYSNEQANARADKILLEDAINAPANPTPALKDLMARSAPGGGHILYKGTDDHCPDSIKDNNGDIVLDLCKMCGKGESELSEPCATATQAANFHNVVNPLVTEAVNNSCMTLEEAATVHPIMTSRHLDPK